MGTMLETTHTCNSRDKNSSNTPLSTHRHDAMVRCCHTSSHHCCYWCCPFRFLSPVKKCYRSTMQAVAGTHPGCADVHQPRQSSGHRASSAHLWTLFVPSHDLRYQGLFLLHAWCSKRVTACPCEWQLLLSLLSQVSMVIPFLPSPLLNTGFHLAGITEKREQNLPGSTALTNITVLSGDNLGHTIFLGKFV